MIKVEEETTSRLDTYLAEKLDLSRSKIQKLIKEDLVTVNGKNVNGSYQVKLNDEIEVNDDLDYEMKVEPENNKKKKLSNIVMNMMIYLHQILKKH